LTGIAHVFILSVVLNNWDNEEDLAMLHALGRHGQAHRIDDFMAQGARCGWCACPVRLRGFVLDQDRRVVFSSHGFPDTVVLRRRTLLEDLLDSVCFFPDQITVQVVGAPPIIVSLREVGS
jgi:hypothetical protein